ncbi:hypothetical protein CISIN_1g035263mg [Citrus sinensis]|uniref:Uncharacterized protein n=1 Tax=Citrus sinensis TaxID=2711 RepID=A0A067E6I4_CITSI|nr:hypothetical protein CISIN_1g035263mg [Citrus sinensis]
MIDVDPNTGNTGKYTARRFPTGSFLESTETFVNVESLTAAHFKLLASSYQMVMFMSPCTIYLLLTVVSD